MVLYCLFYIYVNSAEPEHRRMRRIYYLSALLCAIFNLTDIVV